MRIPPSLNCNKATEDLKELLVNNPPYNSKVSLENIDPAPGWCSKITEYGNKVNQLLNKASE